MIHIPKHDLLNLKEMLIALNKMLSLPCPERLMTKQQDRTTQPIDSQSSQEFQ